MNKLSKKNLLASLTTLLYIVLVAKLMGVALMWYLPGSGVEFHESKNYTQKYRRYDFSKMLEPLRGQSHTAATQVQSETDEKRVSASIDSIILKGLYGTQNEGFAIVAQKAKPNETTLVATGESFAGYTLKSIGLQSVLFTKGAKEYIVKINNDDTHASAGRYSLSNRGGGVAQSAEDTHEVRRSDIRYYSRHPSKIWKDISIKELYKNGKITGFKVTKVRPGSKMATLGLQKGDIIIKANNVALTSYKAVMDLYKNINKIDALELIVLRNNEEKEIVYEIR